MKYLSFKALIAWALVSLQGLSGIKPFSYKDILWAIWGGCVCPALSVLLLIFWIESGDTTSSAEVGLTWYSFFFGVVIVTPLVEEFFFRGILWRFLEAFRLTKISVSMITSIIFVMAHVDAVHIVGVIPISFFLGWLRQKSGSIIPTIVCHAVNNFFVFVMIMYQILFASI